MNTSQTTIAQRQVQNLLSGTKITRASHPVLVSLLELAAEGPNAGELTIPVGPERDKWAPRISRQWTTCVVPAFHSLAKLNPTDKLLLKIAPTFQGVRYVNGKWLFADPNPRLYRRTVAELLDHVADCLRVQALLEQVGL